MSQQRKITDEREARQCLAAARVAGEKPGQWARANGIDGRSLNAWRMNLARRKPLAVTRRCPPMSRSSTSTTPASRAALVELVPRLRADAPRRYVVQLGEARVEFGDDFDAPTLRRVLEVLRTC